MPTKISHTNVFGKINFASSLYYNSPVLGDPIDYDELVAEDAGIEASLGAGSEARSMSMEVANSLLNANDDDMDTSSNTRITEHSARVD